MIKRPRVLITGASGFIGSHLLFDLIDLNFEVLAISRSKGPDLGKNLTWMSADISSLESLKHKLKVITLGSLVKLFSHLNLVDIINLVSVLWDKRSLQSMHMLITKRKLTTIDAFYYGPKPLKGVNDAKELYEKVINK